MGPEAVEGAKAAAAIMGMTIAEVLTGEAAIHGVAASSALTA